MIVPRLGSTASRAGAASTRASISERCAPLLPTAHANVNDSTESIPDAASAVTSVPSAAALPRNARLSERSSSCELMLDELDRIASRVSAM